MNRPSAYTVGIIGFTLCGAWIASIAFYVLTHWGTHSPMLQGLMNVGTRGIALEMLLGNLAFGVVVASTPALVVAVLATLIFYIANKWLNLVAFVAVCGAVGTVVSYLFEGGDQSTAISVSAGAIASVVCGVALFLFLSLVRHRQAVRGM